MNTTLRNRAEMAIAHGALTNSKRFSAFVDGVYPTHLVRGRGPYVWDKDGNRYVDYIGALGTSIVGYANQRVNRAVTDQLTKGSLLSLGTELEVEFAEKIKGFFPYMERIRVLKSGSEGCSAAVRIARAHNKSTFIRTEGYHGWHDNFLCVEKPAHGVAHMLKDVTNADDWEDSPLDGIVEPSWNACEIVEPCDNSKYPWRHQKRSHKPLLIFDETITALRFPKYSYANQTGIYPDISVMGKALANGLPISIVGGRVDVMESDYFVSSTFAGDTLAMRACMEVLQILHEKDEHSLEDTWIEGQKFIDGFNSTYPDVVELQAYPMRGVFQGESGNVALFMQEACKAGVLFGPSWFYGTTHYPENDNVLDICNNIKRRIKYGEVKLEGKMPVKPFSQEVRDEQGV